MGDKLCQEFSPHRGGVEQDGGAKAHSNVPG